MFPPTSLVEQVIKIPHLKETCLRLILFCFSLHDNLEYQYLCRKILTHGIFGKCQRQRLSHRTNKISSLGCPTKYEYTRHSSCLAVCPGCQSWCFLVHWWFVVCYQPLLYGYLMGHKDLSLNKNSCWRLELPCISFFLLVLYNLSTPDSLTEGFGLHPVNISMEISC